MNKIRPNLWFDTQAEDAALLREEQSAVHAEYLASLAACERNGAYQVPGEFAFLQAVKPE